ncbi:hypothetical protein Sala_0274 [Sphingopyxis alaskensis RB2256]|uniref:Core-binding (CB) domain-containing protein n=1 Tax=Sphingopyxis alaskensis (strain DSM 13593 / LMG 18877 / RB2256) TaxID=317655 RepID=Q1GWH5_SPHAL|nr:hypothetical protein Sala_0274 [Sphingopyxis alaskensis RB2256]
MLTASAESPIAAIGGRPMSQNRSRDDFIRFLDYLGEKGLIARATASARRTAVAKVLAVLSDDEAEDVTNLDIDHVMGRFDNLNPHQYTPDSLQTYRSRLKTALEDFRSYSENPVSFRPSGQSRMRQKANGNNAKPQKSKAPTTQTSASPPTTSSLPMVDLPNVNQLPVQLRQNLTVRIFGLPFDLTMQEAQKIANIVLAHASPE